MLGRLVRLEILKFARDSHLTVAMGVFSAVLILSGTVSWLGVREDTLVKTSIALEERQRWLGQGEKDPHSAAHYSIYVFRPTRPLQLLDPGIVPFVGEAVWLEAHHQNDLLFRPQQDADAFERLGLIDPTGLLIRFGPLAVFLLAFAAAARERELGVLSLVLGAAPTRGLYLWSKVLSVFVAGLVVLVAPVALTGALGVSGSTGRSQDVLRLTGWTLGAVTYVGILSAVAVSIGIVARSVRAALGGLLLTWIIVVLAALPAASAAAQWRNPIPSFQELGLALTKEAPAYWTPETGAQQIASILRRYGVTREEGLGPTINLRGAQLDVAERHAQAVFDQEIGGFYDRIEAQEGTFARFGWLSPAVALHATSTAFAGTDFFHHRHFVDFAEQYRRALVNRMNADLMGHPPIEGREHVNDINLWSEVPPFEYAPLSASSALRSARSGLLALGGWLVAAAALVTIAARSIRP